MGEPVKEEKALSLHSSSPPVPLGSTQRENIPSPAGGAQGKKIAAWALQARNPKSGGLGGSKAARFCSPHAITSNKPLGGHGGRHRFGRAVPLLVVCGMPFLFRVSRHGVIFLGLSRTMRFVHVFVAAWLSCATKRIPRRLPKQLGYCGVVGWFFFPPFWARSAFYGSPTTRPTPAFLFARVCGLPGSLLFFFFFLFRLLIKFAPFRLGPKWAGIGLLCGLCVSSQREPEKPATTSQAANSPSPFLFFSAPGAPEPARRNLRWPCMEAKCVRSMGLGLTC